MLKRTAAAINSLRPSGNYEVNETLDRIPRRKQRSGAHESLARAAGFKPFNSRRSLLEFPGGSNRQFITHSPAGWLKIGGCNLFPFMLASILRQTALAF
jgi:hypothetical protein